MAGTSPDFAKLGDELVEAISARTNAKSSSDISRTRRRLGRVLRRLCAAAAPVRERLACRGRKPIFDAGWGEAQMLDILASDADGLPSRQCDMIDRLRLRFENDGRAVPSDSWLKQKVRQFYSRTEIAETEAREKFAQSLSLQEAFGDPAAFISFCRTRDRLEKKWLQSKDLQHQYPVTADYVAAIVAQHTEYPVRQAA